MTPEATLLDAGRAGTPLTGELVIDAHMHVDTFYNFFIPRPEPFRLLESALRLGIRMMVGSSLRAIRGDAAAGNAGALQVMHDCPGRFLPYLVVKPNFPEETAEVIALAEREGVRQFKIHDDGNDLPYNHAHYLPFYEWADAAGAIVLAHTFGRKHVVPLMEVARQFRRLTILLAHSGITEEEIYAEAVRTCDNILLETCSSMAWSGLIERLVAMAGADRVLFGTDMPFMSPAQQLGRVVFSRISDDDKRKILGLNAQRLFA